MLLRDALQPGGEALAARLIAILSGLFLLSLAAGLRAGYLSSAISAAVIRRVRSDMFARLQTLSAGWFARQQQGDVLSRIANDVAVFEAGVSQALHAGFTQLLTLVAASTVLVILDWRLAVLVLAGAALVAVTYRGMAPRAQRRSIEVQEQFGAMLSVVAENFAASFVVRVFGLGRTERARFDRAGRPAVHPPGAAGLLRRGADHDRDRHRHRAAARRAGVRLVPVSSAGSWSWTRSSRC